MQRGLNISSETLYSESRTFTVRNMSTRLFLRACYQQYCQKTGILKDGFLAGKKNTKDKMSRGGGSNEWMQK